MTSEMTLLVLLKQLKSAVDLSTHQDHIVLPGETGCYGSLLEIVSGWVEASRRPGESSTLLEARDCCQDGKPMPRLYKQLWLYSH